MLTKISTLGRFGIASSRSSMPTRIVAHFSKRKQEYKFEKDTYILEDEESGFKPKQTLEFRRGYLPIYRFSDFGLYQFSVFLVMGVTGSLTLYLLNKLSNYHERSYIALALYGYMTLWSIKATYSFQRQFNSIVLQMDLKHGGRKIRVLHVKQLFFREHIEYDIKSISHPPDKWKGRFKMYPIMFDGKRINAIDRNGIIPNAELFKAVLSRQYINTMDAEDFDTL